MALTLMPGTHIDPGSGNDVVNAFEFFGLKADLSGASKV
jgi:hypothetical protein